jgi:hypothetical protein
MWKLCEEKTQINFHIFVFIIIVKGVVSTITFATVVIMIIVIIVTICIRKIILTINIKNV